MPRFMFNGQMMQIAGKYIEYNNGVLAFQVNGTRFPMSNYETTPALFNGTSFTVISSESNTAIINWGDGNIIAYSFKSNNLIFAPSVPLGDSTRQAVYNYTDGNTGLRTIKISFSKPDKIISFSPIFCDLRGSFPNEISNLPNLNTISVRVGSFTSFPVSIANLINLRTLILDSIGTAISERIPEEFLSIPLTSFSVRGSTNLLDPNTSNFKNLCVFSPMRNTLTSLSIRNCPTTFFPEISNLINLTFFDIWGTGGTVIPQLAVNFSNLQDLRVGNGLLDYGCIFPVGSKISTFFIESSTSFTASIPASFSNLTFLKTLIVAGLYTTTARVDAFIANWYNFINANAAKSGANTLPFRGIALNVSGGIPTGTYQQPTGYVAGSNNGTAASSREMLWLLVNQYGGTVIYTT